MILQSEFRRRVEGDSHLTSMTRPTHYVDKFFRDDDSPCWGLNRLFTKLSSTSPSISLSSATILCLRSGGLLLTMRSWPISDLQMETTTWRQIQRPYPTLMSLQRYGTLVTHSRESSTFICYHPLSLFPESVDDRSVTCGMEIMKSKQIQRQDPSWSLLTAMRS